MSSNTVVLAPGAVTRARVAPTVDVSTSQGHVTVAALAAVPILPTGATVLTIRAAVADAETLATAPGRLRDSLLHAARHLVPVDKMAADAEIRWQAAAEAAVRVNGELRTARAAIRRAGLTDHPDLLPLPRPVELAGRSLTEVCDDCTRNREQVAALRRQLAEAWRRQVLRVDDLDTVGPWLANLDAEAETADLRLVLGAAERVLRSPDAWVAHLSETVARVNVNLERARRHATEAAAYLEGLAAADVDPADPAVGPTVAGLESVLLSRTDLVESLRADARWFIAEGERSAVNRHIAVKLRSWFAARGFDVDARLGSMRDPRDQLELSRADRPDHAAHVVISGSRISHRTVARRPSTDIDRRRADAEWSRQVAGAMAAAMESLAAVGIDTESGP